MVEPISALGGTVIGGVLVWAGKVALQWFSGAQSASEKRADRAVTLDQHNDKMAIELIVTARAEIALLKEELGSLRALEKHLFHLDQALELMEAMLSAEDASARALADRHAGAFVRRVKAMRIAEKQAAAG